MSKQDKKIASIMTELATMLSDRFRKQNRLDVTDCKWVQTIERDTVNASNFAISGMLWRDSKIELSQVAKIAYPCANRRI